MPICKVNVFSPAANIARRPISAFILTTMLGRAAQNYSCSSEPKTRKPLKANPSAANSSRLAEATKRKFERTMGSTSGLGALHESTYFYDENDFDDDTNLNLDGTPPRSSSNLISYPTLTDSVVYPSLPPAPDGTPNKAPPSSAPVPWSSSPPDNYLPPCKRRTIPWLDKDGNDKSEASTPLQTEKSKSSQYPWNKTASVMKQEQKELRKRNQLRTKQAHDGAREELIRKASSSTAATIFLSDEQKAVEKLVVEDGKSVFFTGSAGTGKSVLMRSIIAKLKYKFKRDPERVAATASTGLAACHIEGITLHSFAGIGLGKEAAPELVKKIKKNAKSKLRWQRVKVLIIDEVSMVDGDLFDKLEQIARAIRGNGRPFGGIQLVVTGDFFQLPPVPERERAAKFAFEATTWNTCIEHTILLSHIFRQKDPLFTGMLNEIRLGKLTPASIKAFQSLSRPLEYHDELVATEL